MQCPDHSLFDKITTLNKAAKKSIRMEHMKRHLNTEKIKSILVKPIVLVGMMGTGKSHLGKVLAESLDIPFHDSDHVVEARGGITINEIFELYGEAKFRESETRVITDLLKEGACVIATGGGALTTPAVLDAIKAQGISVWLKTDIAVLMTRLEKSQNRPLLKEDNPEAVLQGLLEKRKSLYAQSDVTIQTHDNDINQTTQAVLNGVLEHLSN